MRQQQPMHAMPPRARQRRFPIAMVALLATIWASGLGAQGAPEGGNPPPEVPTSKPEPKPVDKVEEARRKRMARLGSGRIRLPEPIGQVYALEALIERGMAVNPQLVARQHAELFAELRTSEAAWAHAPVFDITSSLTAVPAETDFNDVGSNIDEFFALNIGPFSATSIKFVVPLYTFGKIGIASDLADLGVDQAQLDTKKARLKIITQIREAYYSVQLGKHIQAIMADGVGVIRDEIARQDEAREFGDEDIDVGALRKLQMYEADITTKLIDNERLIRLAKASLAILVQLEVGQFDVTPFDEKVDTSIMLPLDEVQALAAKHRIDMQLLDKALEARQLQSDLALSKFFPDVFFALDFSVGFSTEDAPDQEGFVNLDDQRLPLVVEPLSDPYNFTRLGFVVGARLKINPANQYFKYKQAEAKLAETRGLRKAARQGIALDVEKVWVEVDDNRRKIEALERKFKAAERQRTQKAISYESGGADLNDLLGPLKDYYEARLQLLAVRYAYRVSVAKLGRKVGLTDFEALAAEISAEESGSD